MKQGGSLVTTQYCYCVASCPNKISEWDEVSTSSKAKKFVLGLIDLELVVSLFCLSDVMSVTSLSKLLQSSKLTVISASSAFTNTVRLLKAKRKNCSDYLHNILCNIQKKMKRKICVYISSCLE